MATRIIQTYRAINAWYQLINLTGDGNIVEIKLKKSSEPKSLEWQTLAARILSDYIAAKSLLAEEKP